MIKFVFVKNCLSLKPLNYTLNYYDVDLSLKQSYYAFSALTLLVGRQEEHQACKE